MATCKICGKPAATHSKATAKLEQVGSNSINKASKDRIEKGYIVHKKCQQNWINKERVAAAIKSQTVYNCNPDQRRLRSATLTFKFKKHCKNYCKKLQNVTVSDSMKQ